MITSRDQAIQVFVEQFGACRTAHIKELFFENASLRRCQKRLSDLYESKALNREQTLYAPDYLYYIDKKPKQIEHKLLRTDAFFELRKHAIINAFIPEYEFGNLRADAYFETWREPGTITPYFLEVQRNAQFDQSKYESAYGSNQWKEKWRKFPTVIILSECNIKIKPSEVRYVIVNEIKKAPV